MKDNVKITRSPVADMKSIKNATEVEGKPSRTAIDSVIKLKGARIGFRQSHIRDGAALVRYFSWLEAQSNEGVELSESQAADRLEKYRS